MAKEQIINVNSKTDRVKNIRVLPLPSEDPKSSKEGQKNEK